MGFKLSGLAGPIFGGTMLAFIGSSDAEAAPKCDGLDLSRETNISEAITNCLKGGIQPIVPPTGPIINEVDMRSCEEERNRTSKMFEVVCRYAIPKDRSCPADADGESTRGNRFDPKLTMDGRSVGTKICLHKNLVPPRAF